MLSVATTTTAAGVHTATATLNAVNAGAGVDAEDASGWVLVKAGDTVSVSYTGDDPFAPSLRTIVLL